jgi:FecR protein
MRRVLFQALIAAACFSLSISTYSAPWGWVVQKTSGSATYRSTNISLSPVKKGLVFGRGTIVRTGDNGKVLLVRSDESVFIGPYTTAAIAQHPSPRMQTTVHLQRGQANLTVQKKSRPHFSVETPYLVAVVKGTKFKVAVTSSYAEVAVQEGRVQVRALKTGKYADIIAGQKAVVDKAGNLKLSGKGRLASIRAGAPRAAAVTAGSVNAQVGLGIGSGSVSLNGSAGIGGASVGVGASVGGGVSAGVGASVGGASVGAGASVGGGVSAGAGASVGGISAGVGASVGGGGIGLGGGLSLGGKSLGGSLGLGRR